MFPDFLRSSLYTKREPPIYLCSTVVAISLFLWHSQVSVIHVLAGTPVTTLAGIYFAVSMHLALFWHIVGGCGWEIKLAALRSSPAPLLPPSPSLPASWRGLCSMAQWVPFFPLQSALGWGNASEATLALRLSASCSAGPLPPSLLGSLVGGMEAPRSVAGCCSQT